MDEPHRQRRFGAEGAGAAPDAEALFRELRDAFDQPGSEAGGTPIPHECLDWCPVCRTADVVRATMPPEVRAHWSGLQREMLLLLRAAIDAYVDRMDPTTRRPVPVEDIPID